MARRLHGRVCVMLPTRMILLGSVKESVAFPGQSGTIGAERRTLFGSHVEVRLGSKR